jgi:hypothetical protein
MALLRREGVNQPVSPELGMLIGVTEKATEEITTSLYRSLGFDVLDEEASRTVLAQQANAAPQISRYETPVATQPNLGNVATAETTAVAPEALEMAPGVTPLPDFRKLEDFQDVVQPYNWDEMAQAQPGPDDFRLAA